MLENGIYSAIATAKENSEEQSNYLLSHLAARVRQTDRFLTMPRDATARNDFEQ